MDSQIFNTLYYSTEPDILNLLDKDVVPLIPVNCVGVMGAGLAKQFKDLYPHLFEEYVEACNTKDLEIGHILLLNNDNKQFILFPTKIHWKDPSKIEYISSGLNSLMNCLNAFPEMKIAIPPLGCGLGGLDKSDVLPLIYEITKYCQNKKFLVGF